MVIIMKTAKFLKKLLACTMAAGLTAAMTGALSAGAAATEYQLYEMAVTDMPLGSYDTNQAADAADGVPNVKDCQAASLAQEYAMMDGNALHGSIVEVYDTITVTSLGKVFMDTMYLPGSSACRHLRRSSGRCSTTGKGHGWILRCSARRCCSRPCGTTGSWSLRSGCCAGRRDRLFSIFLTAAIPRCGNPASAARTTIRCSDGWRVS